MRYYQFKPLILMLLAVYFSLFSITGWTAATSFNEAKTLLRTQVYHDQSKGGEGTLYCGCQWTWVGQTGGRVDLASCGYQARKQQSRAERIEWEHIVPAWVFGHQRQCWQQGGRKNCIENDAVFRKMEGDMHNLAPSIGEVNGDRSNLSYSQLPADTAYPYGMCRSRVDFKQRVFEPRDEVKGQVARVYFYMHDRYNLSMSSQQQQLLIAWDQLYPVSDWERLRDQRIAKQTGQHNPFVTGEMSWTLGHKNSGEALTNAASVNINSNNAKLNNTSPVLKKVSKQQAIKGNMNSKIYHLSHCSGYKSLLNKNAVFFASESEAQKAGYRIAKNCKP